MSDSTSSQLSVEEMQDLLHDEESSAVSMTINGIPTQVLLVNNLCDIESPTSYQVGYTLFETAKIVHLFKPLLIDNEMTDDVIAKMDNSDIDSLFAGHGLSDKIKFKSVFKNHREASKRGYEQQVVAESSNNPYPRRDPTYVEKCNLTEILSSEPRGIFILETQRERPKKLLHDEQMTMLNVVCLHFIYKKINLQRHEFSELAKKIKQRFPAEIETDYLFVKKGKQEKKEKARGLLADMYYRLLQKHRDRGLLSKRPKMTAGEADAIDDLVEFPKTEEQADIWCRNFNDKSFKEIRAKWKEAKNVRRAALAKKKLSIEQVYDIYKCLGTPNDFILIVDDFEHLFPDTYMDLFHKWDTFVSRILPLIKAKADLKATLKLAVLDKEGYNEDERDALIISHLAILLKNHRSRPYVNSKGVTMKFKPSTIEMTESVIIFVERDQDLELAIKERETYLSELGQNNQPYIAVVGRETKQVTIRFDNKFYSVQNIKTALDYIFKIYFIFNLEYPFSGHAIYTFIQHYFFQIKTKADINFVCVNNLIGILND